MDNFMKFIGNEKFYMLFVYFAVGFILYKIIVSIIDKIYSNSHLHIDKRKKTIISLLKNITKYLLLIVFGLEILKMYGINTSSILASLGIISAVIGLAFKDIMTDFLSGIFILFDNQYKIGDLVEINGFQGEVVSFGLRTTKVKAFTGEVMIVSNSSFKQIINYNLKNTTIFFKIPVSYDTKLDKLEKIFEDLRPYILEIPNVTGKYQLLGVDEFADSAIIYMLSVDVKPKTNYAVKRKVLRLVKDAFDKNNIEIPYNKLDVNIGK